MKKNYIFLLLIAISIFGYSQQVPNGDFELWTGNTPNEWDTSNESVMGTNFSTVTKETVAFSGSFAAKVKNDTKFVFPVGNVTMPGILTLGDFVLDIVNQTGNIVGGKPFTFRPYSLKGYYKSTPLGGNTPMIGIGLSKWNNQTNTRDTIGFSVMYFPNTVNTWTEFEIVINWTSSEIPDSMNIIVAASDLVNGQTFATNSAIFVDNLHFEYLQENEIISVGDFNPLYVAFGTSFNQLPLPELVWVTLDDNSTELLNVVWQQGDYPANGDIPGEYILEGDIVLVPGIQNPNNLKANITVIIMDPVSVSILSMEQINIYPNPVNDVLYIESENVLNVELFNISGQKVIDSVCLNNKIDLSGYPAGTYILKLYSDDKVFIQKIIKE